MRCTIERQGNAFMIRAGEQLLPPYAYMTYQPAKGRYADFREAGVRFVSVAVYAGDRGINPSSGIRPFRPGFMTAPGKYDFSWADEDFRRATCGKAPGEAFILPRLMLEMPVWWEAQHPEALCRDAAGTPAHCSFSSPEWFAAAVEAMEAFQKWLEESGWNEYIVGWHLAGGSTEEYIRPHIRPGQYLDYSACSRTAWREWLRERYGTEAALSAAWGREIARFEDAKLPSPAERAYPMRGDLRDPEAERSVIDFYDFYGEEIARFIRRLAGEAKRITRGEKLVGVFYGNVSICTTEISHNAMDLLLACPDVDFFASPFCYTDNRGDAFEWPFQATLESASLHGKPWFVEADVRTMLSEPISRCMPRSNPEVNDAYDGPVWFGPDTLEGSLSDMLRALMRVMTHAAALWWFDMWGGWYDHAALMDFQKWAYAFYEKHARAGGLTPRAQLAVFVDEKALNAFHTDGRMCMSVCYNQFVELGWVGAPYDAYLLSDLARVDPARYRAALLLSPGYWTQALGQALERWKKDGRTVLFTGYPFYLSGDLGAGTGIACAPGGEDMPLKASYKGKEYPSAPCFGPRVTLLPAARDAVLARDEGGVPMAVLHRADGYQTFWSLAPELPAELVRDVLLLSGAHIYTYDHDGINAGGDFVCLHACSDGVKRVWFPAISRAFDERTGERIPGTELWCELRMKKGESRLLRLEKP